MFGALFGPGVTSPEALTIVAQEFTPRFECFGVREVLLDLDGISRLFGSPREIAEEIKRESAGRALRVRIAVAPTRTSARLAAQHYPGITIIEPGTEAEVLSRLPIGLLANIAPAEAGALVSVRLRTLQRWGIATLGELAALEAGEVAARLGQEGVAWQRLARGEDPRPLVPDVPEERFEQALDLEWPIEGLEPLSFVLGRLCEPLSAHLERRDRGAAVLRLSLQLVTKQADGTREVHARVLQLPTPIRDARTLRTLALLDLESNPPAAAIDRVTVSVDPTPGRIVQFSLLTRPLPSPEQVSTLIARLDALMGQGRSGSPARVDSWRPGAFTMRPFVPTEQHRSLSQTRSDTAKDVVPDVPRGAVPPGQEGCVPFVALRRFRRPVPARVRVERGAPVRVMTDRHGLGGGAVTMSAGPWRTSGEWWCEGVPRRSFSEGEGLAWDRDEWDVTLSDGATYRVFRERDTGGWFVEGVVD